MMIMKKMKTISPKNKDHIENKNKVQRLSIAKAKV